MVLPKLQPQSYDAIETERVGSNAGAKMAQSAQFLSKDGAGDLSKVRDPSIEGLEPLAGQRGRSEARARIHGTSLRRVYADRRHGWRKQYSVTLHAKNWTTSPKCSAYRHTGAFEARDS